MPTKTPVPVTRDWKLIYDSTVDGDYNGLIQAQGAGGAYFVISDTMPAPSALGVLVQSPELVPVVLKSASTDRLYARAVLSDASIILGVPGVASDGQQVAAEIGSKTDPRASDTYSAWSLNSLLRGALYYFINGLGEGSQSAATSDTGTFSLLQLFKRLLLKTPAAVSNTFNLTAAGQDCQVAVSEGHQTVSVSIAAGSINGTLNLQYSNDDGTSWFNLINQLLNTSATPTQNITATGSSWDAPIPADATHVRLYANTISSGSATGKIIVSARPFPAPQSVWAGLMAGSSRFGSVYAAEVHYQDTTTALTTGTPTFSATIRDCKNAGSGAVAGSASYAKTYSVIACGDKTFDLFVYISENGSTLYKAYKVSATQVDSGLYVAEITITPKMRWAQAQAALTGGVSMTQFTMATSMLAN